MVYNLDQSLDQAEAVDGAGDEEVLVHLLGYPLRIILTVFHSVQALLVLTSGGLLGLIGDLPDRTGGLRCLILNVAGGLLGGEAEEGEEGIH